MRHPTQLLQQSYPDQLFWMTKIKLLMNIRSIVLFAVTYHTSLSLRHVNMYFAVSVSLVEYKAIRPARTIVAP